MWVKGSADEEGLELDETKQTHGVHKEARQKCAQLNLMPLDGVTFQRVEILL